jgi:hypothetical protein
MSTNILSKFKQNEIADFIDSIDSPVRSIEIVSAGSGYANGEDVIFDGVGTTAVAKVFTDSNGVILYIAIIDGGNYEVAPTLSVQTAAGYGAILTPVLENDNFYVFAGRPLPYQPDDSVVAPNYENVYDGFNFQYDQMYFGIKVTNTDVAFVAPRYTWASGTQYNPYDDKDVNLPSEAFYVVTSANLVFKCIGNAANGQSTVEPSNTVSSGMPPTLSDGYQWKYMYQITGPEQTLFGTPSYIPVFQDANVQGNAIPGAIFNVFVEQAGAGYPCSTGQVLAVSGNTVVISANTTPINNYFANSTLTAFGTGNEVTNFKITQSFQQGANNVIVLATTPSPDEISVGFQYQIAPTLNLVGDGLNFEGYLLMNQQSQSIVSVQIVDPGTGYNIATAQVISGTSFGSGASLRPIISPPGGHGSDVFGELYCQYLGLSASFANNVGLPDDVTIRTVGLLKNPEAYGANGAPFTDDLFIQTVSLNVSNTTSSMFSIGEEIIGNVSRSRGAVALCNSSVVLITGYTGAFLTGETLNGQTSGVQFIFNSSNTTPDVQLYTGDILYLQNINATQRSSTSSEQLKMIVRL